MQATEDPLRKDAAKTSTTSTRAGTSSAASSTILNLSTTPSSTSMMIEANASKKEQAGLPLRRRRTRRRQSIGSQTATQRTGGRGKNEAQAFARSLWDEGLTEEEVRAELKLNGFQPSSISQLIKATRLPAAEGYRALKPTPNKENSGVSKYVDLEAESDHGGDSGDEEESDDGAAEENNPSLGEANEEGEKKADSDPEDFEDDPLVEPADIDMLSDPDDEMQYVDGCGNIWSTREVRDEFDEFWGPYDDDEEDILREIIGGTATPINCEGQN